MSEILKHYQVFWENGIDVDFVGMEEALENYKLVCAPLNYLYREGYAGRIRTYVEKGGCYVTTCFSGVVDDTDLCFLESHPLEDIFGIVTEEIDAPGEGYENGFVYQGVRYLTGRICEIGHALDSAEVLAVYDQDFYAGCPVVTRNRFGKGSCYYIASETGLDFLRVFYRNLFEEAGIHGPLGVSLPYGVTTAVRSGKQEIIFVMNFRQEGVCLQGIGKWKDAETQELIQDRLELSGFSCRMLCGFES